MNQKELTIKFTLDPRMPPHLQAKVEEWCIKHYPIGVYVEIDEGPENMMMIFVHDLPNRGAMSDSDVTSSLDLVRSAVRVLNL